MKNFDPVNKKILKEGRKVSVRDSSKLLAEFFNGVVIKADEEYIYDEYKISSHRLILSSKQI